MSYWYRWSPGLFVRSESRHNSLDLILWIVRLDVDLRIAVISASGHSQADGDNTFSEVHFSLLPDRLEQVSPVFLGAAIGLLGLRLDLVQRHHSRIHVVVDVAMEHPNPGIVRNHVHGLHLCLHEGNDVGTFAVVQNHVAVPVGRVYAELLSECDQIPADSLAFLHRHHRTSPIDMAVDGEFSIGHGESRSETREVAFVVDRCEFDFVHAFRIGCERLDVVVEIPADVLVE